MRVGQDLILTDKEKRVNDFLMSEKRAEVQASTMTKTRYLGAEHFFLAKERIEATPIYDILKQMPKGGNLHLHDHAITSIEWMVKNHTYLPNVYTQVDASTGARVFSISKTPLEGWENMEETRKTLDNVAEYDNRLIREMSIWVPDPYTAYPTVNDVWGKFNNFFDSMGGFTKDLTLAKWYFEEALEQFYEDGVQYMELRGGTMKDYQRKDLTIPYLQMIQDSTKKFQKRHPDFIGVKMIIAGKRYADKAANGKVLNQTVELMKIFPDLVKGFDLVAQEDVFHTTAFYADELLKPDHSPVTPYFFHAGETDWTEGVDVNLVDSVLMKAKRIGHGYAAMRHPKVMEAVLKKKIAIELNPISNQVLGLTNDLRDHPGAIFIAYGAPVVICSDDPVAWFARPLSHDFYYTFMALGAANDDLRLLKKLIFNSFKYSTMTPKEVQVALRKWQGRWDTFLDDVIAKYNL
ncbi:unnamed protein product [Lymnaea stagnalis]|uniref:adenosine deaminase n=1 Tax=Lymnaea stagnalis TaxID=6523 RepID=A0AAV2GY46_LYMST